MYTVDEEKVQTYVKLKKKLVQQELNKENGDFSLWLQAEQVWKSLNYKEQDRATAVVSHYMEEIGYWQD